MINIHERVTNHGCYIKLYSYNKDKYINSLTFDIVEYLFLKWTIILLHEQSINFKSKSNFFCYRFLRVQYLNEVYFLINI